MQYPVKMVSVLPTMGVKVTQALFDAPDSLTLKILFESFTVQPSKESCRNKSFGNTESCPGGDGMGTGGCDDPSSVGQESNGPQPNEPSSNGGDSNSGGGGDGKPPNGDSGKNLQPLRTVCMACGKTATQLYANPAPIYCANCCSGPSCLGVNNQVKEIVTEQVKASMAELLEQLQGCLCEECGSKLRKLMEEVGANSGDCVMGGVRCGVCGYVHAPPTCDQDDDEC